MAIIVALGTPPAARAAKAATSEIPIVFALGTDPVQVGLVESLNHPGGNVTGISTMNLDIAPKWVDLLHELLPTAKRLATLVNIQSADSARAIITGTQAAGFALGTQIEILFANNQGEIDTAFADLGGVPLPMTPAEFSKLIADETEKWAKVIRAANIKPE